jgi:hypothetical protein
MTTPATNALQCRSTASASTSTTTIVADAGECLPQKPEHKGLWTNGLPDRDKIKDYMDQLAREYTNRVYTPVTSGQFRHEREIKDRHKAQDAFYGEMHYLEDLLYSTPVRAAQAPSTTIAPYQPAKKRKRGRPATGVKPRDRRVNRDDDSY